MKPLYIFASRIISFWLLIPLTVFLYIVIQINGNIGGIIKLYPLIICTAGAIIFSVFYFLRTISIIDNEIKFTNGFNVKDSACIKRGNTLSVELRPKKRVGILLYGKDGYNPDIKWLLDSEGEVPDICLFRAKAYGRERIAKKILKHFGADEALFPAIFSFDEFHTECERIDISASTVNDSRIINIKFKTDIVIKEKETDEAQADLSN